MSTEISTVHTPDDIASVAQLAQEIWRQHFTSIIGAEQVEYMLEKFQSTEAISTQIENGWEYYWAKFEGEPVGYTGLVLDIPSKKLMLSKLYVKESARGKGVGNLILDYIERKYKLEVFETLWLTLNRFNKYPISWYKKHGFSIVDEVKKDIGNGFFMDDYIMEKGQL